MNIQNEIFYFPLQAMMTLLKPTKTPLLGLLNRNKLFARFSNKRLRILPLK